MDIVAVIAEGKIREAMERGEFKNLAGQGKPLPLDDLSGVPEELRVSYKILKNAGILPPEMELEKEIVSLRRLINCCYDDTERDILVKKMNEKILRFNMLMERKGMTNTMRTYKERIYSKLGG